MKAAFSVAISEHQKIQNEAPKHGEIKTIGGSHPLRYCAVCKDWHALDLFKPWWCPVCGESQPIEMGLRKKAKEGEKVTKE